MGWQILHPQESFQDSDIDESDEDIINTYYGELLVLISLFQLIDTGEVTENKDGKFVLSDEAFKSMDQRYKSS